VSNCHKFINYWAYQHERLLSPPSLKAMSIQELLDLIQGFAKHSRRIWSHKSLVQELCSKIRQSIVKENESKWMLSRLVFFLLSLLNLLFSRFFFDPGHCWRKRGHWIGSPSL